MLDYLIENFDSSYISLLEIKEFYLYSNMSHRYKKNNLLTNVKYIGNNFLIMVVKQLSVEVSIFYGIMQIKSLLEINI